MKNIVSVFGSLFLFAGSAFYPSVLAIGEQKDSDWLVGYCRASLDLGSKQFPYDTNCLGGAVWPMPIDAPYSILDSSEFPENRPGASSQRIERLRRTRSKSMVVEHVVDFMRVGNEKTEVENWHLEQTAQVLSQVPMVESRSQPKEACVDVSAALPQVVGNKSQKLWLCWTCKRIPKRLKSCTIYFSYFTNTSIFGGSFTCKPVSRNQHIRTPPYTDDRSRQ